VPSRPTITSCGSSAAGFIRNGGTAVDGDEATFILAKEAASVDPAINFVDDADARFAGVT
jgi:hypothetical protein